MESLSDIAVFVRVVELRSFTAAAEALGMAKSGVSKHVTRLEDSLGVKLLHRTTRTLSLTEAGQEFFAKARDALDRIDEARTEATRHQAEPSGTLRVTAPMSFGLELVAPVLPEFLDRHPKVAVDLAFDDRVRDIVAEGIDVAVRITQLADSSLVARRLAPIRHVIVASPGYLERHGTPRTPDDLRTHDCLIYTLRSSPDAWRFDGPDGRRWMVPVRGSYAANNSMALRAALAAGRGIALMTTFTVGEDLRAGRLVQVLPEFTAPELAVHAVYPERRRAPPKVKAFVEFLAERFGDPPFWERGLPAPGGG